MTSNAERRIASVKTQVKQIYLALQEHQSDLQSSVNTARDVMHVIGSTTFMSRPGRVGDQVWLIEGLQRLAYHDFDTGGVRDIADWCLRHWLRVLTNHPENVEAHRGLGQSWLWRAQPCLARIYGEDGSVSSVTSSDRISLLSGYSETDYERDIAEATTEANSRLHTADYVEARGLLLPSTEYFAKAVQAADTQGILTGDILASAAESYMSLGNVSYTTINAQYFRTALGYLKRASELPGYALCSYLQR
ncbi:MAG: hypothetical protein M1835_001197 [Candelina submexicana]|nr:MAG: hypothetical protein M1835_001197 [Candelina submexicana]